jgi:inhibitor of cysteine peptidase
MNNFRKTAIIVGLIAITIITLMTACSSLPKQVSADASSSGKQIEIAVGGSIAVTLDSNATTGYSWELKGISNPAILEKTDNKYEAPTSELIGAGGKEVWTFKALKAGTTTLNMEYSQPWEGGQKGANSFSVTVVVK